MKKTAFMIAAPTSGSGKTTIARGLMALLTQKGHRVQPFKCGPDYIDTKFHETVCGRPSVNLDTFMATPEHITTLFSQYGAEADVCIVEGMMGLFDGFDRDKGSSAEVARVLQLPVVLVVDAKSAAYSMAPLLSGFIHFRQDVRIVGVIFNKVGSERHYKMLQQVCNDLNICCLGYLPKQESLEQGSRYLGLDFSEPAEDNELIRLLEAHVDWERVLDYQVEITPAVPLVPVNSHMLIARNRESFSFIYHEMIDRFKKVDYFDPETEVPRLEDIDLLYLPGGYPEKHLEALADNKECLGVIRDFADKGGRIQAECGGMMYLCREIISDDGSFPMCGVLPYSITARKEDRKLSLGYRRFVLNGHEYRGHEFHYTQFTSAVPESITQVFNAKGERVTTPVLCYKNVLASYTHLYPL